LSICAVTRTAPLALYWAGASLDTPSEGRVANGVPLGLAAGVRGMT